MAMIMMDLRPRPVINEQEFISRTFSKKKKASSAAVAEEKTLSALEGLPFEILAFIFSFIDPLKLFRLACISKTLCGVIFDPYVILKSLDFTDLQKDRLRKSRNMPHAIGKCLGMRRKVALLSLYSENVFCMSRIWDYFEMDFLVGRTVDEPQMILVVNAIASGIQNSLDHHPLGSLQYVCTEPRTLVRYIVTSITYLIFCNIPTNSSPSVNDLKNLNIYIDVVCQIFRVSSPPDCLKTLMGIVDGWLMESTRWYSRSLGHFHYYDTLIKNFLDFITNHIMGQGISIPKSNIRPLKGEIARSSRLYNLSFRNSIIGPR